jgi:3-oxoacyl-[acyl-carrier protein] reductase
MGAEGDAVAVVTGGASGIGWAIGCRLLADGWHVVVADIDEARARARLEEAMSESLEFRRLDVRDRTGVSEFFPAVARQCGRLDLLVNCAGVTGHWRLEDLPWEEWRRVIDIDLDGAFVCLQAAGRVMLEQGSGCIVNIASIAAERGAFGRASYCIAKAGLVALTKVAAVEWTHRGVRVNAVGPGYVDTPFLRAAYDKGAVDERDVLGRTPARRLASADEIAAVVAFLASSDASYVSGHTLYADGGFLADYGVSLVQDRY